MVQFRGGASVETGKTMDEDFADSAQVFYDSFTFIRDILFVGT